MKLKAPNVVLHLGYPKTATTTFQLHLFPKHSGIEYLGKFIPSHRFKTQELFLQIDSLYRNKYLNPKKIKDLKDFIKNQRLLYPDKTILLSSESFLHTTTFNIDLTISRIKKIFYPCRIWVTFREQLSLLKSFYLMHGQYGQYLYIDGLMPNEKLKFPLDFKTWINLQKRAPDKNLIGILKYNQIASLLTKTFGKKNILFTFYEDLKENPISYVKHVSNFLKIGHKESLKLLKNKCENKSVEPSLFEKIFKYKIYPVVPIEEKLYFSQFYENDYSKLITKYKCSNE
jgi:hypothetical protein